MLINEIKEKAKKNKVFVYFDMDGVLVEYGIHDKKYILDNTQNFFANKRPLTTILKVAKCFSFIKNIEIGILSNAYYKEQKIDKLNWLKRYAPYIKDKNIHIIVLSEEKYTTEDEKRSLKANYLKQLCIDENANYYLIEDDHRNIKMVNKLTPIVTACHVSNIIK